MFRLDEGLKVYLHREPVDFRLSINGLAVLVEQALGLDPFASCAYVFSNRRRNRVKILGWERNGFWLLMKRLEEDKFIWPSAEVVPTLTVEQLHWLLDGIDIGVVQRHPHLRYGWRIPFLASILLLAVSVWIRLSLRESPTFQKMKAEGRTSKAPLSEAFGQWGNLKLVLIALFGLVMGQSVIWYTGQFYALFFLLGPLKVDGTTASILVAIALAIGTPFFIFFGALSDKIGRKPIIMAGFLLAVLTIFPLFKALTAAANPDLAAAQAASRVTVTADPADCSVQFNMTGISKFTKSCDIAKQLLSANSVSYDTVASTGVAKITVGDQIIESYSPASVWPEDLKGR